MIEAGKLDREVIFERLSETVLPSGAVDKAWTPMLTTRAEIRELRAEEAPAGFGSIERQALVVVIRWPSIEIKTEDRVIYGGRSFDIKQIAEIGRRRGLKLVAVAA